MGSGETVHAEEMVFSVVPDGRSVRALVNATPIRSEHDEVVSVVVTLQDMTELEELERLRAEFLGMVSHELRTPLTSIRGSATTVLDDVSAFAPGEVRQFLRIIVDQADRMRGLISDLLDVAHIETGSLSVDPEPADVASLVDEARKTFLSGGGREGLSIDIAPDLPLVMADARRIVQVLGNLFSNAARHSEDPFPIRVTAVRRDIHVVFSVADEGKGIKAERLPHLFRKFARLAGGERERDLDGVGLGLAICKGVVEAHGGRIWAESDGPGRGARFTFTIPVVDEEDPGTATSAGQPTAHSQRAAGELPRILVVDDEPQALRQVRDALSKAGYAPIVTGDPEEALRIMEGYEPQLVLLDLMLPGTDGIELMEAILEIADVPIIFLSAYGQEDVVARAFDKGAVDYVVKPFSPTELAARIRSALRRRMDTSRPERFALGELTIDYAEREVTIAGRAVPLTATEYRLLAEFSEVPEPSSGRPGAMRAGSLRGLIAVTVRSPLWGLRRGGPGRLAVIEYLLGRGRPQLPPVRRDPVVDVAADEGRQGGIVEGIGDVGGGDPVLGGAQVDMRERCLGHGADDAGDAWQLVRERLVDHDIARPGTLVRAHAPQQAVPFPPASTPRNWSLRRTQAESSRVRERS